MIRVFITASIIFLSLADGNAQTPDSLAVRLAIKSKIVRNRDDLIVTLTIESFSNRPLILPKPLTWGFLLDSSGTGFVSLELQKLSQGKYKHVSLGSLIDDMPPDTPDTLQMGDIKRSSFTLSGTFGAEEGDYRVRVLCFTATLNKQIPDTYSNWVYFHCEKNVYKFSNN